MNNQKVTPLWESDVEYPVLRKPASVAKPENITTNDSNVSNLDLVEKSTLSVDAKEFFPASFCVTPSSSSVQDRLKKFKPVESNYTECSSSNEFNYLYNCIELLTVKPGKFDNIVPALVQHLEQYFNDVGSMSKITGLIFTQALNESNFTYSGARLCAVLNEQCPLLRGCLHQLCEKELENFTNLSAVTLFFAEIYTQMNYELFGKCLLNALKKMLATPTPENVKYICQTLKLSGGKLDKLDKDVIDKIMDNLSSLCPTLPSSMSNLVKSVVTLRSKQWGMSESYNTPPLPDAVEWSDEAVYYGPDGQELTMEESEFLTDNLNDLILGEEEEEDPDALWNPEPEMNEEIQAAFAEFVRMSHR